MRLTDRELPEYIYYECPRCDDVTEHDILKARMGRDNITGTFRCRVCERTFSDSIRIPRILEVPVLFSDGTVTEKTATALEENEILSLGDEFNLDDGRRVSITLIESADGVRRKKELAANIVRLWVKQFDVLSVKVSVNDNRKTFPVRIDAEPDDVFTVGMVLSFNSFDAVVHAIKTRTRLVRKGDAEAREIRRIYAKKKPKNYAIMDFEEDADFDESEYLIEDDEDGF